MGVRCTLNHETKREVLGARDTGLPHREGNMHTTQCDKQEIGIDEEH